MTGQGFLSKCILIAVDQVNAVYENVERHVIPCDAYTWESVVYVIATLSRQLWASNSTITSRQNTLQEH